MGVLRLLTSHTCLEATHAGIYVKIDAGVARVDCRSAAAFAHSKHDHLVMVWAGGRGGTGEELTLLFLQMTKHLFIWFIA